MSLSDAEGRRLAPAFLLPAVMSLLAAVLAWALALAGESSAMPLGLIVAFQVPLTLAAAAGIGGSRASALNCWQRRVAPSASLRRVRRLYLTQLARLAGIALVGPLLMVASIAWLQPGRGALALAAEVALALVAALLAGVVLGSRVHRTLTTWKGAPGSVRIWRWTGGQRRWRHVPTQQEIDLAQRGGSLWLWPMMLPQTLIQAPHWRFHAWGQTLTSGWDLCWAGLWMCALGLFVNAAVIGPPLHWRARLAPGGQSPAAWARRMVAGSMLNAAVWISVALMIGMAVSAPDVRAVQLTAWAPVVADALLIVTCTLWLRGRSNNGGVSQLIAVLGLGVATVLLLGAAQVLGFTPQRGLALMIVELSLAMGCAVAAQRAWARQDLNRLAPPA